MTLIKSNAFLYQAFILLLILYLRRTLLLYVYYWPLSSLTNYFITGYLLKKTDHNV